MLLITGRMGGVLLLRDMEQGSSILVVCVERGGGGERRGEGRGEEERGEEKRGEGKRGRGVVFKDAPFCSSSDIPMMFMASLVSSNSWPSLTPGTGRFPLDRNLYVFASITR